MVAQGKKNQSIPNNPQSGAVRCCRMDGSECVTPGFKSVHKSQCIKDVPFDQAEAICQELGKCLCTPEELSNNICCRTGCQFDKELVWQKRMESIQNSQQYKNNHSIVSGTE